MKDEYREEHHVYGAKIAEELLSELNYDKDKLQRSYSKLSDDSKEFYKLKYESAMSIFK